MSKIKTIYLIFFIILISFTCAIAQRSSLSRYENGAPLPYDQIPENVNAEWSVYSAINNSIKGKKHLQNDTVVENKSDTLSNKAQLFFGNVWDQFGFAVNTRVDFAYDKDRADDHNFNFNMHTLQLVFDGYVIPQVRYYVKLRLTSSSSTHRDNTGSALNKAWVAVDIKNFSIMVGRQDLLFAAWEYDQDYADMYISSLVNDKIDGVGSGINVDYKFFKQHIAFQVINSSPVNFTDTKNSFAWTLRYVGDFGNGLFQPAISFTLVNNAVKKGLYYLTAGIKFERAKWKATLDYYGGKYVESTNLVYGHIDTVLVDYVHDHSLALNLEYHFLPQWNAVLKGTFDSRYDTEINSHMFFRYGISAAIEYMPFKKLPLRAHIAFSYRYYDYKPQWIETLIGKSDLNEISATLGLRWHFQVK